MVENEVDYQQCKKFTDEIVPEMRNLFHTFIETSLLQQEIRNYVENLYSLHGISFTKFHILMHVYSEPEMVPSELAEKLSVTRAAMTGLVDSLEKDKFLERINHPSDRRKVILCITEKGEKYLERVGPMHVNWISRVMGAFSYEERLMLKSLLSRLRDVFHDMQEDINKQ